MPHKISDYRFDRLISFHLPCLADKFKLDDPIPEHCTGSILADFQMASHSRFSVMDAELDASDHNTSLDATIHGQGPVRETQGSLSDAQDLRQLSGLSGMFDMPGLSGVTTFSMTNPYTTQSYSSPIMPATFTSYTIAPGGSSVTHPSNALVVGGYHGLSEEYFTLDHRYRGDLGANIASLMPWSTTPYTMAHGNVPRGVNTVSHVLPFLFIRVKYIITDLPSSKLLQHPKMSFPPSVKPLKIPLTHINLQRHYQPHTPQNIKAIIIAWNLEVSLEP